MGSLPLRRVGEWVPVSVQRLRDAQTPARGPGLSGARGGGGVDGGSCCGVCAICGGGGEPPWGSQVSRQLEDGPAPNRSDRGR